MASANAVRWQALESVVAAVPLVPAGMEKKSLKIFFKILLDIRSVFWQYVHMVNVYSV